MSYTSYLPGRPLVAQREPSSADGRSPSPIEFRMPECINVRHMYRIEREIALKRLLGVMRFLGIMVLAIGALMVALVYANTINTKVTLTLSTLPPCYCEDKLNLTVAKAYLHSPMRAYVPFNMCSDGDVDILIMVHSGNDNVKIRKVIRESSKGKQSPHGIMERRVEVVYVLDPIQARMSKEVAWEMIHHHDLLIPVSSMRFPKTVGRSIAMFQWTAHFCPQAKFVIRTQDTVYFNITALLNFTSQIKQMQHSMFGFVKNGLAGRNQIHGKIFQGKAVNNESIASLVKYKEYIREESYIVTNDAIRSMCIQASMAAPLGMKMNSDNENITVTGIWPTNAGVHLHDINDYFDI